MLTAKATFSGFSVDDQAKAKAFYQDVLGLKLLDDKMGLDFELHNGGRIFIYDKGKDHQPATFTILNFVVDDIDQAMEELSKQGVTCEHYDNMPAPQDEKGVLRGLAAGQGPDIAWFKDPAGNILSVLQPE